MKKFFLIIFLFAFNTGIYSQYFGRNKLKYKDFNFRILSSEHFNIYYYYHTDSLAIMDATRMAERWYHRYHPFFKFEIKDPRPIILYLNHGDFQQTNTTPGMVDLGVGGFTEGFKNRLVMPFTNSYSGTDHVLGHEMVHEFQYGIAQQSDSALRLENLPLWMIEGMAEYMSIGPIDSYTAMYLRDALQSNTLPSLKDLSNKPDKYFPYRFGQAFWAYINGKWGDAAIPNLYRLSLSMGMEMAMDSLFNISSDSLSKQWIATIKSDYGPLMSQLPKEHKGKTILSPEMHAGKINLAPNLSPDGKYVTFLSEKSLFSIEMFLADAHTGKIINKLTETATNAHIDAINFIGSSGSWSPDGKKFIFTVYAQGENEFVIINVEHPEIERKITVKNLGALADPSWSPDGNFIAFSGMKDGMSDLYVLDLRTKKVRQLTNDRYADFQPTWSPDGSKLAFVTDRGSQTDFNILSYTSPQIGLYNMNTGYISVFSLFPNAKHINPQYSPDGKSLFFISDQDGFIDAYRLSLKDDRIYRITNMATGISGITNISQAMSIASKNGDMAFSVFLNNNFVVNVLDQKETQGSLYLKDTLAIPTAFILPPIRTKKSKEVRKYLDDARDGLITTEKYPISEYKNKISLDYLGQAGIGIGLDRFGPQVGGDIIAIFSDVLGNHRLITAFQGTVRTYKDLGGEVFYQNLKHRWSWGITLEHLPILSALTFRGQADDGSLYLGELREHVFVDRLAGIVYYPFSTIKRLEFNSGYTHYGFQREVYRYFDNGKADKVNMEAPKALTFYQGTMAFVGDFSYFGYTSPVKGGRYRIDIGPTFGSLNYLSVLTDYRRYFFFKPLTIAFRTLYYGRFGKNTVNNLLGPLYLGDETLIRGYSIFSLSFNDPIINHLIGNQIAIGNIEFRVPLTGSKEFGIIEFPYFPTELVAFFDSGIAMNQNNSSEFINSIKSDQISPLSSAGLALRINLANILVVQFYNAYPFQRTGKGFHFGFVISPGF